MYRVGNSVETRLGSLEIDPNAYENIVQDGKKKRHFKSVGEKIASLTNNLKIIG